MWVITKEIKHNRRYFHDSGIGISTRGFEITSSNKSKKLKGKRAKLMGKWNFQ